MTERDLTDVPTFPTLAEALSFESALWDSDDIGRVAWWAVDAPGLAAPRRYAAADNYREAAEWSERQGWPVNQRTSGGGCVPQGPGMLNLTWRPDGSTSSEQAYQILAQAALTACLASGVSARIESPPGAWCPGRFDISCRRRKLIGVSQRRRVGAKPKVLVHAAIMVERRAVAMLMAVRAFCEAAGLPDRPTEAAATALEACCSDAGGFDLARFRDTLTSRLR